ncbi:thada/death receptor interacting protein [Anaeramoeba ignava]|uniref:Thada/death receptor interacting protein n=1 Tax=Anaeramoeba ignava TaxID=1746090 RepID=A0A9Q0L5M4_ANAIG|nr:thada/death receptor interacting protein [Anaeramoeba ignava]
MLLLIYQIIQENKTNEDSMFIPNLINLFEKWLSSIDFLGSFINSCLPNRVLFLSILFEFLVKPIAHDYSLFDQVSERLLNKIFSLAQHDFDVYFSTQNEKQHIQLSNKDEHIIGKGDFLQEITRLYLYRLLYFTRLDENNHLNLSEIIIYMIRHKEMDIRFAAIKTLYKFIHENGNEILEMNLDFDDPKVEKHHKYFIEEIYKIREFLLINLFKEKHPYCLRILLNLYLKLEPVFRINLDLKSNEKLICFWKSLIGCVEEYNDPKTKGRCLLLMGEFIRQILEQIQNQNQNQFISEIDISKYIEFIYKSSENQLPTYLRLCAAKSLIKTTILVSKQLIVPEIVINSWLIIFTFLQDDHEYIRFKVSKQVSEMLFRKTENSNFHKNFDNLCENKIIGDSMNYLYSYYGKGTYYQSALLFNHLLYFALTNQKIFPNNPNSWILNEEYNSTKYLEKIELERKEIQEHFEKKEHDFKSKVLRFSKMESDEALLNEIENVYFEDILIVQHVMNIFSLFVNDNFNQETKEFIENWKDYFEKKTEKIVEYLEESEKNLNGNLDSEINLNYWPGKINTYASFLYILLSNFWFI